MRLDKNKLEITKTKSQIIITVKSVFRFKIIRKNRKNFKFFILLLNGQFNLSPISEYATRNLYLLVVL